MSRIIAQLESRHIHDIFVTECKDGPSMGSTHLRLDAWAMNRSWTHRVMTGYEMKVSREDFFGDHKWMKYAPLCNELYIVCPAKMLSVDEVRTVCPHAGLMWSYPGKLLTKKKAVFRDIEEPIDLLLYVLICRTQVARHWYESEQQKGEFWKDWLQRKGDLKDAGHRCSARLRKLISEQITEVHCKNRELERQIAEYESIKKFLEENKIPLNLWGVKNRFEQELGNRMAVNLRNRITNAVKALNYLDEEIVRILGDKVV